MKFSALFKKEWRNIKDIIKTESNHEYQLEGIEGKVYAKDIEDIKVNKNEITNPDGSIYRFEGKEVLKKPLTKSSTIEKWNLIKAKLNHKDDFMSMDIFNEPKSTEPADEDPQQSPDEAIQQPAEEQPPSSDQTVSSDQRPEDSEDLEEQHESLEGDDLENALKELGYSDIEIAHIIHDHAPAAPSEEEQDHEEHKQNLSQDEQGHEQTLGHRDAEHDIDLDHKKKMNELELEYSKKEKEIKIKHLEEELAIKRSKMNIKDTKASKGASK